MHRPSWRPGGVGSCSRMKAEAIILPWLTNELKGRSSGLHNTLYSGWERPSGCQRAPSLLGSSDQSRHSQGCVSSGGTHTKKIPGATYPWGQAAGSSSPTRVSSLTAGRSNRGHCNSFITKFQSPCTVFTMSLFKGSAVLLGLGREGCFFFLRVWEGFFFFWLFFF